MVDEQYLMICMLKGMMQDKNYALTISSVFEEKYFDDPNMSEIFKYTKNHIEEHKSLPDKDIVINSVSKKVKDDVISLFTDAEGTDFNVSKNYDWLLEETNKYLKDRAIKMAILDGIDLIDSGDNIQQIRDIIETALCKDIKIDIGLDYFNDLSERLKRIFNATDTRIKTYYPTLDDLFNGGFPPYTLNMFIAKIHGHKCVCGDTYTKIKYDGKISDIKISDIYKYTYKGEYTGGINMPSKESFINKHGENEGIRKYNLWRKKLSSTKGIPKKTLFINKYGIDEGTRKYEIWLNKNIENGKKGKGRGTLQWYINKYGIDEGTIKYQKKCKNIKLNTKGINTLQWYIDKYGVDEGTRKYQKKNLKISDKGRCTLQWYIDKYGVDEGTRKYQTYIKKQKKWCTLNGYIDKYGQNEGTVKWNKRCQDISKRNTLDGYIDKYGQNEGTVRYKKRQEKWITTLNNKEPKEIERINRAKFKNLPSKGYSNISQKLFVILYDEIKSIYKNIYFATLNDGEVKDIGINMEYFLMLSTKNVFPDFFVKDINKIIEFDGDYWHSESRGNVGRDKQRDDILNSGGYDVLHIKEIDFKMDCDSVINKCLCFLEVI